MQQAFLRTAGGKDAPPRSTKARVQKVADRVELRDPRENIKLSFRTAQKLKTEGVIH